MTITVVHPGNRSVNWCDVESSRFFVRSDGHKGQSFYDYYGKHLLLPLSTFSNGILRLESKAAIYRRGAQRLVLFPDRPGWIGLEGEVDELLQELVVGRTLKQLIAKHYFDEEQLNVFISALFVKGVLSQAGILCTQPDTLPLFRSDEMALVELSKGCNLHCKHCFNMSGKPLPNELCFEQICDLIDKVIESRNSEDVVDKTIVLSGGEPLQHPHIFDIIDHINVAGYHAEILTNGILLTAEMIAELQGYDIRIRISLDGCAASSHEWMRGKGTFKPTVAAIKLACAAGLDVGITTSISNHNLHETEQIIALVNDLGVSFFQFIIVNHLGRAARRNMFAGGHTKFYESLFSHALSSPDFRDTVCDSTFGNMIGCSIAGLFFHHCGLGYQKNYYVQADGDVFPCRSTIMPEFNLGNIRDQSFDSFNQFDHKQLTYLRSVLNVDRLNGKCMECDFRYWCAGDCRGEAYQTTGDIAMIHPSCGDLLKSFETILWMTMSSPELYFDKSEAFLRRARRLDAISTAVKRI